MQATVRIKEWTRRIGLDKISEVGSPVGHKYLCNRVRGPQNAQSPSGVEKIYVNRIGNHHIRLSLVDKPVRSINLSVDISAPVPCKPGASCRGPRGPIVGSRNCKGVVCAST